MRLFPDSRATQNALELRRRFAALGTVGLVDDNRIPPLGQVADLLRYEGELLECSNNDGHGRRERLRKLGGIHVDLLHYALLVFELVDRVLKLLVEDYSVRHDNDRVEDLLVFLAVEARQPVDEPGD